MGGSLQRWFERNKTGERIPAHLLLGQRGERAAIAYLQSRQYRLVATNFIAPIGYSPGGRRMTGEIDLIAYDESSAPFILAFIEVKTRSSARISVPEAAVDLAKQTRITKAARVYRRLLNLQTEPFRYDVVSILQPNEGEFEIQHLRGYFSEQGGI